MSFPKKTREGRDVFVRFYYPLPHTYCSLFLYFFPPAGFPVVDLLQQKCNMNKAPQLFAGKIGEISQTGEDRHGKGSPPALSTQFRMEKSQQAPWVMFHRDPISAPRSLHLQYQGHLCIFIPLNQAHPPCTSTGPGFMELETCWHP